MNTAFEEKAARNFLEFDDDSCICGKTGIDITPQISARIGQALAMGGNVVVGRNETNAAIAITNAIVSGALGAGTDVWYLGSCFGAQLDYAMKLCNAKMGIFITADAYTKIYAYFLPLIILFFIDDSREESFLRCLIRLVLIPSFPIIRLQNRPFP